MVKKRTFTPEELERVIRLRERPSPESWLAIQKETGIPRAVAEREYKAFKASQSVSELKGIRQKLAEEEFVRHLYWLTKTAKEFATIIVVSKGLTSIDEGSDEVILSLLLKDDFLGSEERGDVLSWDPKPTNRMLLKSLRDHLQQAYGQDPLEEWTEAHDRLFAVLEQLKNTAREVVENLLVQNGKLDEAINLLPERLPEKQRKKPTAVAHLARMVWVAIVKTIELLSRGQQKDLEINRAKTDDINGWFLNHVNKELRTGQIANNDEMINLCKWAAKNVYITVLREDLTHIRGIVTEFDEKQDKLLDILHPMKVRSAIIRTKCDLCPIP